MRLIAECNDDITPLNPGFVGIGLPTFEQIGPSIRAEVNSDGVVDIYDLVLVASGIGGGSGAAPAAEHHDLDSRHTREQIQKWLIQAQELAPTDAISQRGIAVLEQLLATLTPDVFIRELSESF